MRKSGSVGRHRLGGWEKRASTSIVKLRNRLFGAVKPYLHKDEEACFALQSVFCVFTL